MNADHPPQEALLLERAADGDIHAWGDLLAVHQKRLHGVASFRLDPRLRGRIDGADVLQETFIAATARRAEFFQQSTQPLFLWLRWMVENTLLELHRHHLGAQIRDARREVSAGRRSGADDGHDGTRTSLVAQLTAGVTGPATAAGRAVNCSCRRHFRLPRKGSTSFLPRIESCDIYSTQKHQYLAECPPVASVCDPAPLDKLASWRTATDFPAKRAARG